jgi:hypothetical protein
MDPELYRVSQSLWLRNKGERVRMKRGFARKVEGGHRPSWTRRGGCASKKKARSIRSGADGVVVQVQKHFRLILNHHPVRSIKGSFAIFLLMSQPPLLARRGDAANG